MQCTCMHESAISEVLHCVNSVSLVIKESSNKRIWMYSSQSMSIGDVVPYGRIEDFLVNGNWNQLHQCCWLISNTDMKGKNTFSFLKQK